MKLTELDLGELENFILGEKLGQGAYRAVYVYRPDPTLVIKVETLNRAFANVHEWDIWQRFAPGRNKRWLAPCVEISDHGTFLLQKRTTPITKREMPKAIPSFLTDEKAVNWGRLDGKVVCHDYADAFAKYSVALRKPANWT